MDVGCGVAEPWLKGDLRLDVEGVKVRAKTYHSTTNNRDNFITGEDCKAYSDCVTYDRRLRKSIFCQIAITFILFSIFPDPDPSMAN